MYGAPPPKPDIATKPTIARKPSFPVVPGGAPQAPFSLGGPPAVATRATAQYCIALYDYAAQAAGDLSFSRDDKIEITKRTDSTNDWWEGRCNGKAGQFPGMPRASGCWGQIASNRPKTANYVRTL